MFTNVHTETRKGFDEGLRQYFLSVYNYVALALAVTGLAAFASLNFEPLMNLIYIFFPLQSPPTPPSSPLHLPPAPTYPPTSRIVMSPYTLAVRICLLIVVW